VKFLRSTQSYVKIHGEWHYLYRAIDREGNLVDVRLSSKRDKAAAKAFFHKALETTEFCPDRVTTDGHKPYPKVTFRLFIWPES